MPSVEIELPIMGDPLLTHAHNYGHGNMGFGQTYIPDSISPLSPSSVYSQLSQPSRPGRSPGSLSFLSSNITRSESSEQLLAPSRRTMERPPVTVSPFRSVRQMKEPFQLKLPHSPSCENNHVNTIPSREFKEEKGQSRSLQSPIGLRPLRTCRSDQNLVVGALETFGLLPSPTLSESRITERSNAIRKESSFQKPKELPISKCPCSALEQICETCLLRTCEAAREVNRPVDPAAEHIHFAEAPEEFPKQTIAQSSSSQELRNPTSTPQMQQLTEIRSPPTSSSAKNHKRSRTTTVSSAASWVPENLTYCEDWLQRVPLETPERHDGRSREANRRKFRIVQQNDISLSRSSHQLRKPADLRIDTNAANNSVMFAVASKTKPKLVDISRPSSSGTTFSLPIHPPPSWRRPLTPERRSINEISAFSPDTPQDIPDSGYVTQQSNRSSDESHEFGDEEFDMAATTSSSEPPCNISFVTSIFTDQKPKHRYYMSSYNRTKPVASSTRVEPPHTPPAVSPKTVDQETLVKWWDYEWTLDQLEDSIKEYPHNALRLTSPVIILIRQNHEKALIRPFRKIFSDAHDSLIDCLCAALIAKSYLVSMASSNHRLSHSFMPPYSTAQFPNINNHNTVHNTNSNLSKLDSVPEKARAMLGIALPVNPGNSRMNIPSQSMNARSLELQKGLDRIVDKLLFTICGRHDETLKAAVTVLTQVLEQKA